MQNLVISKILSPGALSTLNTDTVTHRAPKPQGTLRKLKHWTRPINALNRDSELAWRGASRTLQGLACCAPWWP